MGLKTFTIAPNILATSRHCRLDQKFARFTTIENWIVFKSQYSQVKLSHFLEEIPISKYKKGELDDEYYLVNISDQTQRSGELEDVEIVNEIGSDKTDLSNSDIFVSKLGMPKGYIFLNTYKGEKLIGSTEFIPYKIKDKNLKILIKYFLLHPNILNAYSSLESGKTPSHRRVNPYEFLKIRIPLIPKIKQDQIVAKIRPIEKKIKELKSQITPLQEVINKVFVRELGISENLFNEFGKGMTAGTQTLKNRSLKVFETDFEELSRSGIVRFSTRFHNPPTKKLMNFLFNMETLQVKDILIEPIHRGASPRYNPEGEVPVVKTGHLKNNYIEISQEEFVDSEFYNSSIRSQVKQGDILIASTGKVSLGKIDLLEEDQKLIADGHVSIVRINDEKYSSQFFTYFFRTILGYFQIERDFTGATNQIELYADEISNFEIPNISIAEQQKIVNEIKSELDNQQLIKRKIESERNKIDEIIENAIK